MIIFAEDITARQTLEISLGKTVHLISHDSVGISNSYALDTPFSLGRILCSRQRHFRTDVYHWRQEGNGFTEHVSRSNAHLYQEEIDDGTDQHELKRRFDGFVHAAHRMKEAATSPDCHMRVLIGFEAEWIDAGECTAQIGQLCRNYPETFDFHIGSVHHVAGEPIDVGPERYERARNKCGGTDEGLFRAYFDAQYDMLKATEPLVVGHFDLIRLLSERPNVNLKTEFPKGKDSILWLQILRNLKMVKAQGGVLECNASGLRKGLKEPYPSRAICEAWLKMGGKFVLSDDSHGVDQVGTCYLEAVNYLKSCGAQEIAYLEKYNALTLVRTMPMAEVARMPFWSHVKEVK